MNAIGYLEPGVYACYLVNHSRDAIYYTFSHESAVGFLIGAYLDRNPMDVSDGFVMSINHREMALFYGSDLNPEANTEIVLIVPNKDMVTTFIPSDNWELFLQNGQLTKRYRALITHQEKFGVIVQFDTPDFVAGYAAYYRDFGDTGDVFNTWIHLYDYNRPAGLDITLPILGVYD